MVVRPLNRFDTSKRSYTVLQCHRAERARRGVSRRSYLKSVDAVGTAAIAAPEGAPAQDSSSDGSYELCAVRDLTYASRPGGDLSFDLYLPKTDGRTPLTRLRPRHAWRSGSTDDSSVLTLGMR